MVVTCTNCQAKFRVPDERIGARGAKVRCSRCQTVFIVHPGVGSVSAASALPPAPSFDLEAHTGNVRAPRSENPFVTTPVARTRSAAAPTAAPAPLPPPAADPFAAPAPGMDPFATAAPAADPFGAPALAPDPFAPPAPAGADSFAEAASPRSTLPVTDLSDLLGGAATPPAAPRPDPFAGALRPAPTGFAASAFASAPDPFAAPAPGPAAPAAPPPLPAQARDPFAEASERGAAEGELALEVPSGPFDPGAIALEERRTPPPMRTAIDPEPQLEIAGPTHFSDAPLEIAEPSLELGIPPPELASEPGPGGQAFDRDAFDLGFGGPVDSADMRGQPAFAPPTPSRPAQGREAGETPPDRAQAPATVSAADRGKAAERIRSGRTSRVRAAAVNAVALVALLAVTLALWVIWRSDGPFDPGSLRPAALFAALGRGASTGPYAAVDVRSGLYDRERGAPLVFVRGRVLSHAAAPVAKVRVSVQLVRGEEVIASAEGVAGAVPTPEELYGAVDPAALAAVVAAAVVRAPSVVRPGDSVPFLVPLGDAPAEVEGTSIRVEVGPARGAAR